MLALSIRNEKALRIDSAVEYGARNSALLAAAHVAFYVAATFEGVWRSAPFDCVSVTGLVLYLFGAAMLLVVAQRLGRFWTVRLLIARDHALVTTPLFRAVRHPNYYLNIIPELVGFSLTLHAYDTLAIGLPIYLVPLVIRILLEERTMRDHFSGY